MAKKFDQQLGILPWDAMMLEVRRSAFRVAWIDERIEACVERQDRLRVEFAGDGADHIAAEAMHRALDEELRNWLAESRREREHMLRASAQCVAAGLKDTVVNRISLETSTLNAILGAALDALDLDGEAHERALGAFRHAVQIAATERREDVLTGKAFAPVRVEYGWNQFGQYKGTPALDTTDSPEKAV